MNSRDRKRQVYARYHRRGRHWLTAEDRAWLNMVPIGREFGSKDFERLSILDAFTQGRIVEQKAMSLLGIGREALVEMVEKDGLGSQDLNPGWANGDLLFTHEQCRTAVLTWPDWPNDRDDDEPYPTSSPEVFPPAWGFKELDYSMKSQLQQLEEKFPYMFNGPNLGIDIAPGWMPGFQILCEQIDQLLGEDKCQFHWRQVKEKFGSARWYWSVKGRAPAIRIDLISEAGVIETSFKSETSAKPEPDVFEKISALIQEAETHTEHACIFCGAPGTLHKSDGYVLVLCEEHIKQRNAGTLPSLWADELP